MSFFPTLLSNAETCPATVLGLSRLRNLQSEIAQWPRRYKKRLGSWEGISKMDWKVKKRKRKRESKAKEGKERGTNKEKRGKKHKNTAQCPKAKLSFGIFVAKNTASGTKNPFTFLFPSELLLNCWAQLIVNYTQQVPTITSTEENVHHMPDHKCLLPIGVTYLSSARIYSSYS